MRLVLILLLNLAAFFQVFASDSIMTYTYKDALDENATIRFSDSIEMLLDYEAQYTIEDILNQPDLKFVHPDKNKIYQTPLVAWSRLQLTNAGTSTRQDYFRLYRYFNIITVYTVENGKVKETQITGSAFKPSKKSLLTVSNNVPFSVDIGKRKIFYFKMQYLKKESISYQALTILQILPGEAFTRQRIIGYASQCFYAGIMLLFCVLSLFMYNMFRDRVFIYFSMLVFSFPIYFLSGELIIETILGFNFHDDDNYNFIQKVSLSGIGLSMSLFISRYLRLQKLLPNYFRFYLFYSLSLVGFSYISKLLNIKMVWIMYYNNMFSLIWIVLGMIPIFILSKKKDKTAQNVLMAGSILAVSSFVHLLDLLKFIPKSIWTIYSFQIGTIIFSSIIFYDLFNKISTIRAEKQRFETLDSLKSRFFANISHEFRTPLTLVMGPVKQVMEKLHDTKDKKLLQLAYQNAERLLELINQLLDLSKLEAGKMDLEAKEQNFASLLKVIVMSFESLGSRRNIRLHFVSQQDEILLYVDKDKIEKIFYNLLSNAFKFTKEQGEVAIMLTAQKNYVEILVRDNGIGIPATRLPYIFNRFYQVDSSETREQEGTGIGLALVKELVELHRGTIQVKSKVGTGTTFSIHLPKGKTHLTKNQLFDEVTTTETPTFSITNLLSTTNLVQEKPRVITTTPIHSNDLPLLLIIEDNEDVRFYIQQHLVTSFQIIEAVNGQDGIDKALEHLPDLVISDVMMPKKNGYEVCKTLKTDQRTSHIPVILLTAKAAQEEKLKGLETGADDYLIKPFDTRELEVRVRNLIELRRQLRKRFSDAPIIEPQAIKTNKVDQAFLEKICTTIETNFSNEQFSVEILAQEIGMSRGHLNRKLKALTDQSTNKLIQSLRLQKAMTLLQQKSGNVSDIAFQTGFSSPSYFVKCFRDKYGKTPGTILEE